MSKVKRITQSEAAGLFKDGMTIMIGGFMTNGTAERLVDAIVESGAKNLTAICDDAGRPGQGIGKLIDCPGDGHQHEDCAKGNKQPRRADTAGQDHPEYAEHGRRHIADAVHEGGPATGLYAFHCLSPLCARCAAALSTYIDDTAAAFVAGIYRF